MKSYLMKTIGVLMFTLGSTHVYAELTVKQKLENDGFTFVKEIAAPANMTGWAGHMQQSPATVFISNDQKYYIVGSLYNLNGDNLTADSLDKYVKEAVLDDVWNSLEKSAWIQDGNQNAPRIIYVFSDPNCPYCHAFWERARPWVNSGKVQLRHILVGLIKPESRGQSATLLMSTNPEQALYDFKSKKDQMKLVELKSIPEEISEKLDENRILMEKYGFYATPSMIWKNNSGEVKSSQGLPKDINDIFQ